MTDEQQLPEEELQELNGEELPDREAMSVIQPQPFVDLEPVSDVPKQAGTEPGLPPPRD